MVTRILSSILVLLSVFAQAQMLSFLAGMNQKDYFAFYTVVHTPVVCNDRCFGYWVQKTADSPQLQFIDGRRFSRSEERR